MKNFSDLLATDAELEVRIGLRLITDNGEPRCRVAVNQQTLCDARMSGSVALICHVPLVDPIEIQIEMCGKNYCSQQETAIVIEYLRIEGFDIVPSFAHLARYENEREISSPTSYLGFNGTWTLDIAEPFYSWRHRITGQGWLLEPTSVTHD